MLFPSIIWNIQIDWVTPRPSPPELKNSEPKSSCWKTN